MDGTGVVMHRSRGHGAPRRECALRFLHTCVALVAFVGCAGARARDAAHAPRVQRARRPPDLHGDPLLLLPAGALAWMQADTASLRASPHFASAMALAAELGADFARVERELGFDPFRNAERLALAVYAPPGDAQTGWPLVYVRGGFEREAVLAAARAHRGNVRDTEEVVEAGMTFTLHGERAYLFPAPDVMFVMERALLRRAAARLSGESAQSVRDDLRFGDLWHILGGMDGMFAAAADLAATRSRVRPQGEARAAQGLELLVVRGDVSGDAVVHAAALARDAQTARAVVTELDALRRATAGQILVRLAGLSGFLRDGIEVGVDGRMAFAHVRARHDDVRRLLRATSLVRELADR